MTGKDIRMGKLFSGGHPVIIAMDHGSYMGPFDGLRDITREINQFSKADALLLMPGMAKRCGPFFARKDAPLCIIRLNWAAHYCKPHMEEFARIKKDAYYNKGYNVSFADVKYAVSLGADIVIASLLLGTDEEANTKNITEFGSLVQQADRIGIPLIGEFIPMGGIDRYKGDLLDLTLGTRACAEFGADMIKTVFVDNFEEVSGSSVVPVLALGGGTFDHPSEAFATARRAIEKGAAGVVYGRNVICAKKPAAYLDCLLDVVKNNASPEDAEKHYLSVV
ncbi:aldolase [Spirochaetia bacterium]|nr:aldolase [Spirochaetia bacterium]